MKRSAAILLFFLTALTAFAQPEYFGCHHFKSKVRPQKMTDAQRASLQTSISRADTINIVHYDLFLDVTLDELNVLSGAATIEYNALYEGRESIILDLYELQVDSVTDFSGQLEYNYDDELLQIYFSTPPSTADTLSMTVHYHGVPHADPFWGGVYWELGYIYNLGIGLTTIPPNFGKVWHPCFDIFQERASYSYHVKSDGGKRAMCQGEFMGEEVLGGDTLLRHFDLNEQITTHVAAFAVGDYATAESEHTGEYGTYPIKLHSFQAQQAAVENIFQDLPFTIDALEYWFGPYPYDHVGYVMTTDGALEIVTNIAYPTSMLSQPLAPNGRLSSHELGHHWWGDQVALDSHNDMWLKEGPAEYSAHLYTEWKLGQQAFIDQVKSNQLFVLEEAPVEDGGFFPLSPMPDPVIYGRHTYYKGAAVMHNLRGYLGDVAFRNAMMEIQMNHAEETMTPGEFEQWLEDASGEDLTDFFADWVLQPGWSAFVVDSVQTEAGKAYEHTVYIQQKRRECPNFHNNVPISLSMMDEDWNWHHFPVTVGGEFSEVDLVTDFNPILVTMNADSKLTQNWLDYDARVYPDETFNSQLPFVDFRLIKNEVSDSALVRVEHVWSAPDDDNTAENILEMSSSHYWVVTGDWPESYDMEGRVDYDGFDDFSLDEDLVGVTEEDIMLVYRPDNSSMWSEYDLYTVVMGPPSNGSGTIKIDYLIPGQYAFANRDNSVDIPSASVPSIVDDSFLLYPNPAVRDFVNIRGAYNYRGVADIRVTDAKGAVVIESSLEITSADQQHTVDVAHLRAGTYWMSIMREDGSVMDATAFQVMR